MIKPCRGIFACSWWLPVACPPAAPFVGIVLTRRPLRYCTLGAEHFGEIGLGGAGAESRRGAEQPAARPSTPCCNIWASNGTRSSIPVAIQVLCLALCGEQKLSLPLWSQEGDQGTSLLFFLLRARYFPPLGCQSFPVLQSFLAPDEMT